MSQIIHPGSPGVGPPNAQMSAFAQQKAASLLANYKLTPATLAYKLDPSWIPAKWLMLTAIKVAQAIYKGNARIIISAPPRHGKSRLITVFTSLWIQEVFKTANIILTSYGAELSKDFGREVRNIIDANHHLLDVRIAADKSQAGGWKNQYGGGMVSVGLGGSITGRGADVLLIDDYIKEIKEALSETTREYIWNWFSTTAFTRLEPDGSCIIIATRWHHDDLIGRILKHNPGGKWDYLHIPAIAMEDNDILGRMKGEPLFPERYPLEVLEERKATLGTFFFNALFQQVPENPDASLTNVDWLNVVDSVQDLHKLPQARVWDLAATEDGGDYTTGGLYAYDPQTEKMTILNMIRVQKSPGGVEALVERTAVADGTRTKIYIEQEPGSSGKALIHHFKSTILPDFKVEEVPATDGKITRAQPMLAAAEAGKVDLLKGKWNDAFVHEFGDFPGGAYDDQVDNASIAYTKMSGRKPTKVSWGRTKGPTVYLPSNDLKTSRQGSLVTRTGGATWRTTRN